MRQKTMDAPFPIIAIGASAGGVQALETFFGAMPPVPGMAFVVIMHLAPDRKSLLTEILSRYATMSVEIASDGQAIEKDKIYVIPPAAVLTIDAGRLRVRATDAAHHQRSPIDIFFSALARDRGEHAVGVILSGSGSDGVLGVKAIKQQGGVTLAQATDASGPGFAGMPQSAIASGLVDFAIPVDAMPAKLIEIARDFDEPDDLARGRRKVSADDRAIIDARNAIYAMLRGQMGHDFSGYKTQTFMRRVHRRMQVQNCESIGDYVQRLRRAPEEVAALFRDLLINVTSFFRDTEAFNALQMTVIPQLFEGKTGSDSVRVWAPGCSTGEEVYSIAILLREYMDGLRVAPNVTIFATDIDEEALIVARAARYPEALMDSVSDERRRRFFNAEPGQLVVAKAVRDLCVFSPHSILRDPPFSRMDLISCRNLLIYLGAEAQRHVIPIFHYALRPGGFLFLGMSESIGQFSDRFAPLDRKHCLFQARDIGHRPHIPLFTNALHSASFPAQSADQRNAPRPRSTQQTIEALIAEQFGPPHVVVDEEGDIVHFSTRTGKYLEATAGAPSRHLLTMARKGLRLELRGVLREAIETRRIATRQDIKLELDDGRVEAVSLTAAPVPNQAGGRPLFLILFREQQLSPRPTQIAEEEEGGPASDAMRLESELHETRDRLQATIEEYETGLEEQKSANEELVSLNEEMRSTNEELESSKEQLQSLNEELTTVNHELAAKITDLDRANNDLNNLFESTQIATVFLSRDLVIRRFTPAASKLFNLIASDVGRPLTDLAPNLDYSDFLIDLRKVLHAGTASERHVKSPKVDADYLARLTPYRGDRGQIEGVVATFIDVTVLARSERHVQQLQKDRLKSMNELTNGLAHELNQPLSAATTYLHAAQRMLKMPLDRRPADVGGTLDNAVKQVMWAGRIVDHLRNFVSRDEPKKAFVSLHKIIEEACELTLLTMQTAHVKSALQLMAEMDSILADPVQIKQVLINLIRNAVEAMAAQDICELTISTSLDGDMIRVDVADTGSGVSEKVKSTLFEPFVTTKPRGIGVGLAISRAIIEAHDGRIGVRLNPRGGSIFTFALPLEKPEAIPASSPLGST